VMPGQASAREVSGPGPKQLKVVVCGPFAAGKTTFIRSISEITVLTTERPVSDETSRVKAETTVAMDFGRITLGNGLALHLFGTPGQARFDFMWDVLGEGMLGMVLLVDGSRPETVTDAGRIARSMRRRGSVPAVVAVTRVPVVDEVTAQRFRSAIGLSRTTPVLACDARERADVRDVLLALLTRILDHVERDGGGT
jgi:signal recognition particle receptor subunit beta